MKIQKQVYMTWQALKEKYPDSWVLLANPALNMTGYEVLGGEFIYKNKNRERVWLKAAQVVDGNKITVRYTGEITSPENAAILL